MSSEASTCAVLVIHGIGEQRPMGTLRGFVESVLNDEEEAKDVTQEVFLKAWQVFETIRRKTAKGWLLKTTTNLCIDRLRRRKFQYARSNARLRLSAWDEYNDNNSKMEMLFSVTGYVRGARLRGVGAAADSSSRSA